MIKDDELTKKVIGCAYQVHNALGPGFLEKVYENSLRIELESQGLAVKQQCSIPVHYKGIVVGDFLGDPLIEDRLIIELKAIRKLDKQHEAQLVNYLVATGIDTGLLINIGPSVEVKRKYRIYKKRSRQD
jgi:GxxExxY protein